MSTRAYTENFLAQRNAVAFTGGITAAASSHTILLRLAPDIVTLDVPFNKVTTWDRLIQTIFEIYMRNNPRAYHVTLDDAHHSITIQNDLTGGLIIPQHWNDFVKPHVKISAHFLLPFLPPPWDPYVGSVDAQDEDTDMMDEGVPFALENKLSGSIESAWKTGTRLLGPPVPMCKFEETNTFLPTPLPATHAPSINFLAGPSPIQNGKPHIRPANGTTALVAELTTNSTAAMPRSDPMRIESISPPAITFRDPFSSLRVNTHTGLVETQRPGSPISIPSAISPTRHAPRSPHGNTSLPQRPSSSGSRDGSAPHSNDINPRGTKRNCNDITRRGSSSNEKALSESPRPSEESNGNRSRAASVETDTSNGHGRRLATPVSRIKTDVPAGRTVILHQRIIALDTINAGEAIKIVRTKDGDLIAVHQDEQVEGAIERRQSNVYTSPVRMTRNDMKITASKTAKKRAFEEAQAEELVRIWTGHVNEPPSKKTKINMYEKLTVDHKRKIARFVQEQNIIRVDHWSGPIIRDWKISSIPDADEKQMEDYINEITSNIFSDPSKRNRAFRLFMENHNFTPKSQAKSSKSHS